MTHFASARSAIIGAALAAGLAAAPALAGTAPQAPSTMIRLNDAVLANRDAGTLLHDRIVTAARKVCQADGTSLEAQLEARECFKRAVRSGEEQLAVLQREHAASQPALAAADNRPAR